MTTYIVTNKATGQEVYRYDADAPIEFGGFEFATHDHTATASAPAPAPAQHVGPRRLTQLQFMALFGDERYLALRTLASDPVANPLATLWLDKFNLLTPEADGTSVDRADPRMRAGLEALSALAELQLDADAINQMLGGY